MPEVSTIGLVNRVRSVVGNQTFAPDDTILSCAQAFVGATFTLPGPTSKPQRLPSNGDFYQYADPLGRISGGRSLVINGGGYPILGAASITLTGAFSEGTFTFDDAAQAWIACICLAPGG